jgi:hypothetical protein
MSIAFAEKSTNWSGRDPHIDVRYSSSKCRKRGTSLTAKDCSVSMRSVSCEDDAQVVQRLADALEVLPRELGQSLAGIGGGDPCPVRRRADAPKSSISLIW